MTSASKNHPLFRPNPNRAIFLSGIIDQKKLDELTPQIIAFLHFNRDPITLYIDSPGGSIAAADSVLTRLRETDQDSSPSCHLITVVTGRAASAAADLAVAGDFALAYKDSTLLMHGVRSQPNDAVTHESASDMASRMKQSNELYARRLAQNCKKRFVFRYVMLRGQDGSSDDLEQFTSLLEGELSNTGKKIFESAKTKSKRIAEVDNFVWTSIKSDKKNLEDQTQGSFEGIILKALIDFEFQQNQANPSWSFSESGLRQLHEDFLLLVDTFHQTHSQEVVSVVGTWGEMLLNAEEKKEIEAIPEDKKQEWIKEKTEPAFRRAWFFLVSLSRALQEGENYLSAEDAYWLGLIDEVIGGPAAFSPRWVMELEAPSSGNE